MHILVCGGSRGIGAAMVRLFAGDGHRVTFFYNESRQAALDLQADLLAQGGRVSACRCDATDHAAVQAAVAGLEEPIDALIYTAGVSWEGLLQDMAPADWKRLFAVNVDGAFNCTQAVLPAMLAAQSGHILYMSSIWGHEAASCEVAYSATKGAIEAMTRSLAAELAYSHINVNAIAPGCVATDMMARLGPETNAQVLDDIPAGRYAVPEEIARIARFLLSSDAAYITGQVLTAAGGFVI